MPLPHDTPSAPPQIPTVATVVVTISPPTARVQNPQPVTTPAPESLLAEIVKGTEECSLPCWNDLTPGLSAASEIVPFFDRLGIVLDEDELPEGNRSMGSVFRQPFLALDGGSWFYVFVGWKSDRVSSIGLGFDSLPQFLTPSTLADTIGLPETIQVAIMAASDESIHQYEVVLRYPSIGTVFGYGGFMQAHPAEICIDQSEAMLIRIDLYSPEETGEHMRYPLGPPYASPTDSLGLTQREFFQLFIDNQRCIPVREEALP